MAKKSKSAREMVAPALAAQFQKSYQAFQAQLAEKRQMIQEGDQVIDLHFPKGVGLVVFVDGDRLLVEWPDGCRKECFSWLAKVEQLSLLEDSNG